MLEDPLLKNKIAAAFIAGGLIAGVTGFVSHLVYQPHPIAKNSFQIAEGVSNNDGAGGGAPSSATAGDIKGILASASEAEGQNSAKKCGACHSFEKGGIAKAGPNLHGIIGRKVASAPGFAYSEAMVAKGGNWDYDAMNKFLFDPKGDVKGTKMGFAGVKDDKERANLIKYLRSNADAPVPLP